MKDVHIPHPHDEIRNIWPLTSISVRVKIQLSFDKGLKNNLSILSQGTMRVFKIDELDGPARYGVRGSGEVVVMDRQLLENRAASEEHAAKISVLEENGVDEESLERRERDVGRDRSEIEPCSYRQLNKRFAGEEARREIVYAFVFYPQVELPSAAVSDVGYPAAHASLLGIVLVFAHVASKREFVDRVGLRKRCVHETLETLGKQVRRGCCCCLAVVLFGIIDIEIVHQCEEIPPSFGENTC